MKKVLVSFLLFFLPLGAFAAGKEVYVFNWSQYIDPEVLELFQKETGIAVKYSTFESNEAMFAKLKILKKDGYDVAFPSTYFVERMSRLGMLKPLDHAKLPNMKNLNQDLLNKPYDPNNVYSIPYLWGSSAIGVNAKVVDPASITSWNDLWNPAYKGKVLLMDDVRDVFAMSLRSLGYSGNETDPAASSEVTEGHPGVKVFNSISKQPLPQQRGRDRPDLGRRGLPGQRGEPGYQVCLSKGRDLLVDMV